MDIIPEKVENNEAIIQVGKKKYHIGGITIETNKKMKERSPSDFYPTEQTLIDAYLLKSNYDGPAKKIIVADLGAGDGRWGKAVKNKLPDVELFGMDIRDLPRPLGFFNWLSGPDCGDIYNLKLEDEYFDIIIGNPPYSICDDWLNICLQNINLDNGSIDLLLPLSF